MKIVCQYSDSKVPPAISYKAAVLYVYAICLLQFKMFNEKCYIHKWHCYTVLEIAEVFGCCETGSSLRYHSLGFFSCGFQTTLTVSLVARHTLN